MFSSTELLLKMKLLIIWYNFPAQYKAHAFKIFYDNAVKTFSRDPKIVVILASCSDFFFAKCVQFPLTFKE